MRDSDARARTTRIVAALVACLAITSASAGAAQAAQPGVTSDLSWGIPTAEQESEVAKLQDLSVRWSRLTVRWSMMEPVRGAWNPVELAKLDRSVEMARTARTRVLLVLYEAPAWASGAVGKTTPSDPADFARFAKFLANRYEGRVSGYEIWNEQDLARFWTGGANPGAYTKLLRAAYPAIKRADPGAQVVFGGLDYTWYGADFLERAYAAGAKGYFDAMAVHAYTLCGTRDPTETKRYSDGTVMEGSFARYRNLRKTMVAHNDKKPIWITEFGWNTSSAKCSPGGGTYYGGVSEAEQAEYLKKAFRVLERDPYVKVAFWYMARNWASDADTPNTSYGLMSSRFAPKPSYWAFKSYASPKRTSRCRDRWRSQRWKCRLARTR